MKQLDGVSILALIAVAAFAIERVTTALLFLLTYANIIRQSDLIEDPTSRAKAVQKRQLIYFLIAGVLSFVVLAWFGKIRVLTALGVESNPWLDLFVTGVILLGGSDRISALLSQSGKGAEPEKPPTQALELTGRLILEDQAVEKAKRTAA
jgi:hypothetical protein